MIGVSYLRTVSQTGASFPPAFRPGDVGKSGQSVYRILESSTHKKYLELLSVQLFDRVVTLPAPMRRIRRIKQA